MLWKFHYPFLTWKAPPFKIRGAKESPWWTRTAVANEGRACHKDEPQNCVFAPVSDETSFFRQCQIKREIRKLIRADKLFDWTILASHYLLLNVNFARILRITRLNKFSASFCNVMQIDTTLISSRRAVFISLGSRKAFRFRRTRRALLNAWIGSRSTKIVPARCCCSLYRRFVLIVYLHLCTLMCNRITHISPHAFSTKT